MITVEVLRVFTDDSGAHGNPLGVVLHAAAVPEQEQRQQIAADLAFSETIFIDDVEHAHLKILGSAVTVLNTRSGPVPTWRHDELVWVRGGLGSTPPWWHERLPTPDAVAQLRGPLNAKQDATQLWAWQDQAAGTIRARVFAARYGCAEDEACGSACMRLAAALGQPITVHHGEGSIIHARPGPPATADIGGRVVSDGTIEHPLASQPARDSPAGAAPVGKPDWLS